MSLRSWRIASAAVPASESATPGWPMLRTVVLPVDGSPCLLIQMLFSLLRNGSARYCREANRCRDLDELLITIRVESAFDPARVRSSVPRRPCLRADSACRQPTRSEARKWLRSEVSRSESGTHGSRAFVVRIRESAARSEFRSVGRSPSRSPRTSHRSG